ncbi:MAG: hypothetical protein P9L94_00915 [Candidatus Hinthialibacter antarcticus]|nr:hypothetical protein [Candidatus Hinthialibacter antarcticus]
MNRTLFALLLSFLFVSTIYSGEPDAPFKQEMVEKLPYETLNITPPIQDVAYGPTGGVWILGDDALSVYKDGAVRRIDQPLGVEITPGMKLASHSIAGGGLVLAGPKGVMLITPGLKPKLNAAAFGQVNGLCVSPTGDIWIAAQNGLHVLRRTKETVEKIEEVPSPVERIAVHTRNAAALAGDKLWLFDGRKWRWEWTQFLLGPNPSSLAYGDDGSLVIGGEECVHLMGANGLQRIDGEDGLPYNHINQIFFEPDGIAVWYATDKGVIRNKSYYVGPRWQTGERVSHIDAFEGGAVFADEKGVTIIRLNDWTLSQKAEHFQAQVYPRHDRYGLVAGVSLKEPGNLDSYIQRSDDNDGLWTAMYLASQCFRYAVTNDPQVKERAWKHFEAMERLETITGVPGFPARSFMKKEDYDDSIGGEWHPSADGEWMWKGDTSSDEIVGHMFVYPLVYDLLAETEAEKAQVRGLVSRIMSHIVDNGYSLIDVDGKPTRWGVWAPEKLNDDPAWAFERGLNSLQMVSFLSAAYHVTEDAKFRDALQQLLSTHGYANNTINQKITLPYEDNHSDDELAYLPYYTLFQTNPAERYQPIFDASLERAWQHVQQHKSSLWAIITSVCFEPRRMDDALWSLREWPLGSIDWPVPAAHRLDVTLDRYPDRFGKPQIAQLLPPDERILQRWNGNPYRVEGGAGTYALDPGAWLLPYWMARYHGLID